MSVKSELSTENTTKLFNILAKDATKISALNLTIFIPIASQNYFMLLILLKSQEQSRRFNLVYEEYPKDSTVSFRFYGVKTHYKMLLEIEL